jgi:hypothetical protein
VKNNDESLIEKSGSYGISLSLDPNGDFSCSGQSGSAGEYFFSNCQISTSGNFWIQADGTDLISDSSGAYLVTDPSAHSITIAINKVSQSTYFDFEVTVSIFDQAGVAYTSGSLSVTLEGTIILFGETSGLCDHVGTITLKVYCKESGSNTVTAKVQNLAASKIIEILLSKLKIVSIDPRV